MLKAMCKFCGGMLTGIFACLVCLVVTFKLIQGGALSLSPSGPQENNEPLPELTDPVPAPAHGPATQLPQASEGFASDPLLGGINLLPPAPEVAIPEPIPMPAVDQATAGATVPAVTVSRQTESQGSGSAASSLPDAPVTPKVELPYMGTHPCSVTEKRALELPASVREQMGDKPFLLIAPGTNRYLVIHKPDEFAEGAQREEADARFRQRFCATTPSPVTSAAEVPLERRLRFSLTEKVAVDTEGRFVISREQAEFAGIRKGAVLIGVGDHFELWDAERWQRYREKNTPADQLEEPRPRCEEL